MRIALIAYDDVFIDAGLIVPHFPEMPTQQSADTSSSLKHSILSTLPETDISADAKKALGNHLRTVQSVEEVSKFLDTFFPMIHKPGVTTVFHTPLFRVLKETYRHAGYDMEDISSSEALIICVQEIFVGHYLRQTMKLDLIYSFGELEIQSLICKSPAIPLHPPPEFPQLLKPWFQADTVQELIRGRATTAVEPVQHLMELTVPDLQDVPLKEIAQLKRKEKLQPLPQLAENLRARYGEDDNALAQGFVDSLWQVGHLLGSSFPEVAIGVLSNIPVPISVNPLGIVGSALALKREYDLRKHYAWFLSLSKLRKLARR